MIAVDVNVLVAAFHEAAPDHQATRTWLEQAVAGSEAVGASEAVLTGALRILTHPRVFSPPANVDAALTQLRHFTDQPGVVVLSPGAGYLDVLERLCRETGVRGNDVADADSRLAVGAPVNPIRLRSDLGPCAGGCRRIGQKPTLPPTH